MFVKDCMCKNVYFVQEDSKICDVVNIMDKNNIGSVPVCDNNKNICGIITDRDILLKSVSCNKDMKNDSIKSIMSSNVCTCQENDNIEIAKEKMNCNKIRRLPVIDSCCNVIGILTVNDIAKVAKTNLCNCNNTDNLTKESVFDTIDNICNCK